MVEPHSSCLRVITTNFWVSEYLGNLRYNHPKILTLRLYHRVTSPKDADGMANSVDPDQTGAV